MKLSEFIAEIKTSMKSYDSANLIDEISIHNWVVDELKRFGSNIMELQEELIFVKNGKAKLPDNYWHLRFGARVYADRYKNLDGDDEEIKFSRELYDRIERGASWTAEGECKEITEKTVTEKVFVNNQRVELHYSRPEALTVIRGVKRKILDFECLNMSEKFRNKSPFTVSINNRTLQANFSEGTIYLQYYGLLTEDEEIVIPETQHNRLKTYLEYHVKSKIIEDMILNNDDRNLVNMLQYFDGKARDQFDLAMTEAKFESLNWSETKKLMKNQNKRKMSVYENMFPTI
jgi:hypothetical protein